MYDRHTERHRIRKGDVFNENLISYILLLNTVPSKTMEMGSAAISVNMLAHQR